MKNLLLSMLLVFPLFATNLTLKEGFVSAHTQMLMDKTIDPLNTNLKADISMNEGNIESLRGSFWVDMNLFFSDNKDRDKDMNELIEILKFPFAKYIVKNVIKTDGKNNYIIKGELNFYGKKNDLDFNAEIIQDADMVTIRAKSKILVSEYGIKMPCIIFMCVRDRVDLFTKAVLLKK